MTQSANSHTTRFLVRLLRPRSQVTKPYAIRGVTGLFCRLILAVG
jgi:hypothetical protein